MGRTAFELVEAAAPAHVATCRDLFLEYQRGLGVSLWGDGPGGLHWKPVSLSLVTTRTIVLLACALPPLLAALALAVFVTPWLWVAVAVVVALAGRKPGKHRSASGSSVLCSGSGVGDPSPSSFSQRPIQPYIASRIARL